MFTHLSPEEQKLLQTWNQTERDYSHLPETIPQLFEQQAHKTPEAIAVIFPHDDRNHEPITYQALNYQANQVAHYLQQMGVEPETIIGICMEPSLERVIGLLGILKAGGAYLPLDPAYPSERLTFMLEDTQAPIVLTQAHITLPEHQAQTIYIDADWEHIAQKSGQNPNSPVYGTHPAYIIYTSGSTGTPKGVVGLHQGAINRFAWMWEQFPFEAGEICCQKTSLNFLDSLWEIFGPLLQGIPTVIVPAEATKDPTQLIHLLTQHQVSRLVLVPSLLRVILSQIQGADLLSLKYCVSSGEALPIELSHLFFEKLPHCRLLNLYGSSEVSADVTYYEVKPNEERSIPIGRPIANMKTYILDEALQPVPIGEKGALYIGGIGLARGYHHRPDLTAESFIPDPFSKNQARLYRSGDIARYRPGGNIEYLGRMDQQVKIRGFRVELGEIEAALRKHPAIQQVVVLADRAENQTETRLVAYLVADEALTTSELHHFLKERLPDYMIPATFVLLDRMPLTPSGKIYRLALASLKGERIRPHLDQPFVPPRNALEKKLTELWAEILKLDKVGIFDPFFELGGHSLLATQLVSRLRDIFKVEIPIRYLFEEYNTIARLAQQIETIQWASQAPRLTEDREEGAL